MTHRVRQTVCSVLLCAAALSSIATSQGGFEDSAFTNLYTSLDDDPLRLDEQTSSVSYLLTVSAPAEAFPRDEGWWAELTVSVDVRALEAPAIYRTPVSLTLEESVQGEWTEVHRSVTQVDAEGGGQLYGLYWGLFGDCAPEEACQRSVRVTLTRHGEGSFVADVFAEASVNHDYEFVTPVEGLTLSVDWPL